MTDVQTDRKGSWKWVVSGVLLLATMINYMDRQTLANVSLRVIDAFDLTKQQYGDLEFAFGWAFAAGSLLFGFLVDRISVRWLYPTALLGWSAAGALTGLASSYGELLACRTLLGLFEAGHWPCALATIQRMLSREDRTMGNSVLQSGASLGAVLTPPIVLAILHWGDPGQYARNAHFAAGGGVAVAATGEPISTWQLPFLAVGAAGTIWVIVWFVLIRSGDLSRPPAVAGASDGTGTAIKSLLADRRFLVLLVMVTCLNGTWQLVRAWLPAFLQEGRGYGEADALWFNSAYYIAADVGCLLSGAATLGLARLGVSVHPSRVIVFSACAILTGLTAVVSVIPAGTLLMVLLLLIAAGSLGLFPCYYSFTQELTARHMGKVTGILAATGWFLSSPFQRLFGWVIDQTGSYDLGFALVGLPPLFALAVLLMFWGRREPPAT